MEFLDKIKKIPKKYEHFIALENEAKLNKKIKSNLVKNQKEADDLRDKLDFVIFKTKEEIKDMEIETLKSNFSKLNEFCLENIKKLREYASNLESQTLKGLLFILLDELELLNESISTKEYSCDLNRFLYLYEEVLINAFGTFLSMSEFLEEEYKNDLSKLIFNQMKTLGLISKNI